MYAKRDTKERRNNRIGTIKTIPKKEFFFSSIKIKEFIMQNEVKG